MSQYAMWKQERFNRNHLNCTTCGEISHISELNGAQDCALCAESKIDRALAEAEAQAQHAFNIASIDANLTPTSANYENSVIAYLAGN